MKPKLMSDTELVTELCSRLTERDTEIAELCALRDRLRDDARRADNLIKLQTTALRAARRLVLAFDVGDVAHTTLNGRGYAALAELRAALEEPTP